MNTYTGYTFQWSNVEVKLYNDTEPIQASISGLESIPKQNLEPIDWLEVLKELKPTLSYGAVSNERFHLNEENILSEIDKVLTVAEKYSDIDKGMLWVSTDIKKLIPNLETYKGVKIISSYSLPPQNMRFYNNGYFSQESYYD